jgi:hypothetical protein
MELGGSPADSLINCIVVDPSDPQPHLTGIVGGDWTDHCCHAANYATDPYYLKYKNYSNAIMANSKMVSILLVTFLNFPI